LAFPPNYKLGEQVATRVAYGTALAKVFDIFNVCVSRKYIFTNISFVLGGKE